MSCEIGNQYVNLYFFKNGFCRKPEKIRRRKSDIEKLIAKKGKFCYYHDKVIYTICGEPVTTLSKFVNNSPFVLVEPEDNFKEQKYSQLFNELLQEASNDQSQTRPRNSCRSNNVARPNDRKSRFSPAIPNICQIGSETLVKFTAKVEEESSDDDFCRESVPTRKRKASTRRSSVKPLPQQQSAKNKNEGIFANCCVKPQSSQNLPEAFIACDTDKMTQTTAEDFKCAIQRLKREIQEQRKREKVYKKPPIQESATGAPFCPRDDFDDECEDPKLLDKFAAARDQFFKKRNLMATKIKKSLDKKYTIEQKHGEC